MQVAVRPPLTIVLLGPPGSGKGTQAVQLSAALGIPAISTGDMLRAECASGSALGNSVKTILEAGRLVDDQLINQVVAARFDRPDVENGTILDGYPRTLKQATFLNEFLRSKHLPAPIVIHLDVDLDEVRSRLARRLQCPACGAIGSLAPTSASSRLCCSEDGAVMVSRSDDRQRSAIVERVRAHELMTPSLVRLYQDGNYFRICGAHPIKDVSKEILGIIATLDVVPDNSTGSRQKAASGHYGRG